MCHATSSLAFRHKIEKSRDLPGVSRRQAIGSTKTGGKLKTGKASEEPADHPSSVGRGAQSAPVSSASDESSAAAQPSTSYLQDVSDPDFDKVFCKLMGGVLSRIDSPAPQSSAPPGPELAFGSKPAAPTTPPVTPHAYTLAIHAGPPKSSAQGEASSAQEPSPQTQQVPACPILAYLERHAAHFKSCVQIKFDLPMISFNGTLILLNGEPIVKTHAYPKEFLLGRFASLSRVRAFFIKHCALAGYKADICAFDNTVFALLNYLCHWAGVAREIYPEGQTFDICVFPEHVDWVTSLSVLQYREHADIPDYEQFENGVEENADRKLWVDVKEGEGTLALKHVRYG